MRICLLGKYPPIQGGVSMNNYWVARSLAQRGHEIHIVTNANEVEEEFRISMDREDEDWSEPRFAEGAVRVWNTESVSREYRHIPYSNPFVTKLATLATQVVESHKLDLIYSYYFEPYTVAAYLASAWTGVPYIVRHAGSDAGRLLQIDNLQRSYIEILKRAKYVVSGEKVAKRFRTLGISPERLYPNPGVPLPLGFFQQDVSRISNSDLVSLSSKVNKGELQSGHHANSKLPDPTAPNIGIYGKIGEKKGSFDLISTLGRIKRTGFKFNFFAICHGWPEREERFNQALIKERIEENSYILPFIPHWRIPSFIRAMTSVCFLERDFGIKIHSPTVAAEVLSCGTCLILSSEIAMKQKCFSRIIDHQNALVVKDPRNHDELESAIKFVLTNPEAARSIGENGPRMWQGLDDFDSCIDRHERMLEVAIHDVQPTVVTGSTPMQTEETPAHRFLKRNLPCTMRILESFEDLMRGIGSDASVDLENENTFEAALSLCETIAPELVISSSIPEWLPELMFFELHSLPLYGIDTKEICMEMLFRSKGGGYDSPKAEATEDTILRKFKNIRQRAFQYNMSQLAQEVSISNTPSKKTLNRSPYYYIFQSLHDRPKTRVMQIDSWAYMLLSQCDSSMSIKDITAKIVLSQQGTEEHKKQAIGIFVHRAKELFAEGIVEMHE